MRSAWAILSGMRNLLGSIDVVRIPGRPVRFRADHRVVLRTVGFRKRGALAKDESGDVFIARDGRRQEAVEPLLA